MKHYHWIYLLGIAVFCFVMSFVFLSGAENNPSAVPASLAFTFLGMLGAATAAAVRTIQKRLDILEQASAAKQPAMPSAESGADAS